MKKIKVIFASKHGHSKKVAETFINCYNVNELPDLDADLFIFICPTYGDEELPLEMEDFLEGLVLKNKEFTVCELGNYYGYDDFEFGASKIIKDYLKNLGWKEFFPSLSLDSLPSIDWEVFYKWKEDLYETHSIV